jgi:CheY-like chemotaxis protein
MRILWLDNDPAQTAPYVSALERHGDTVTMVKTVSECEKFLAESTPENPYQLLILDVMVPTKNEKEEERYPPERTKCGSETGLVFWNQWASRLKQMDTKVMLLTVRLGRDIRDRFLESGLPKESFCTKMDLRETDEFLKRVEQIVGSSGGSYSERAR